MPRKNGANRRKDHRRIYALSKGDLPPLRGDMTPEQKNEWFKQAIKYEYLNKDSNYDNFEELNSVIKWLKSKGYGDADIRKLLGFKTDNPVIKGGELNNRAVRESLTPVARADMDAVLGPGATNSVEKYLRAKWAKARKLLTLEDIRTGKLTDLGHFIESMLKDPDLAGPENRWINRLRGASGDSPYRVGTPDVLEEIVPTNPTQAGWEAKAQEVTGNMPTAWGRQQVPIKEATQASDLSFPGDIAELADGDYIAPEQLAPLARELQNYNPTQRRAVIEHLKATGELDYGVNPDRYKTADLTAENGSSKVTQLYQDANGHADIEAQREQFQEQYGEKLKPIPPKGWDFKNYSVRWTNDQLVIITPKGTKTFSRFNGPVDRYDIFESFLNDKVGHDFGRGEYREGVASAAKALPENLYAAFHPDNSPQTAAAMALGRAFPKLGVVMGAYSLANGGVRFAQGYSAAKDGVSWEEYQEQQIQNWLDKQQLNGDSIEPVKEPEYGTLDHLRDYAGDVAQNLAGAASTVYGLHRAFSGY